MIIAVLWLYYVSLLCSIDSRRTVDAAAIIAVRICVIAEVNKLVTITQVPCDFDTSNDIPVATTPTTLD